MPLMTPMRVLVAFALMAGLAACGEDREPPPAESSGSAGVAPSGGFEVVEANCAACHAPDDEGNLSRIAAARKTPEGWDMTVARMIVAHGLDISSEDRRAVVKYLADNQGLAPSETAPYRYALERRPHLIETELLADRMDDDLFVMCGRCHSLARVALQRRDIEEWKRLVNMHAVQWPTIEYHLLSRDRDWLDEATGWVSETWARNYGLSSAAWDAWQAAEHVSPEGRWRTVSYVPGAGYRDGVVTITADGSDAFLVKHDDDAGDVKALVFTGYEWRARGTMDGRDYRHVAAISADGSTITGRWFWNDDPAIGGSIRAIRMTDGVSQIMAATREGLRRGETSEFSIIGTGLSGDVDLGPGVTVETVEATAVTIVVRATVAADAAVGRRDLRVGDDILPQSIAVYDQIDRVVVTPDYAVARVGEKGGHIEPVTTQFEAVAFHNGGDGEPDTDDDFRIGVMEADWQTAPYDEAAAKMRDVEYAGQIDADGHFMPSPAGPNPDRVYGTSNFGDLKIVATVKDGGRSVSGEGRLIATAPRWNNPPLY